MVTNEKFKTRLHKNKQKTSQICDGGSLLKHATAYNFLVVITAVVIAILHRNHISGMFESDRHFSHLSTLERELTFRTEMGLYYSYFKTIAEAPTFWNGLSQITFDNVTEYPLVINTLKRFNLYPEVILGAAYRIYDQSMSKMGRKTKICFQVNRGEDMSAVESCEGLGEKPYFYVESVFLVNGIMMGLFFIFGSYLSGSYWGGLLTVLCFFFNHGECTRVQWTPPLRESFAYPFLVLQMFIVTYAIKSSSIPERTMTVVIAISTVCFMLPWQFAQFALLMQTLSVFATYLLGFIGSNTVRVIAGGQLLGLIISAAFLFGNEMLVTSFFSSALVAIWLVLYMEHYLKMLKIPHLLASMIQGVSLLVMTVGVKLTISKLLNITDDEHIGDIFRSKFTSFKNFHTMLYVCAPEFDFMEKATPGRLTKTLLLPCSIFVVAAIFFRVLFPQLKTLLTFKRLSNSPKQNGHHSSPQQQQHIYEGGNKETKNGVGKHQHDNRTRVEQGDGKCPLSSATFQENKVLEHAELVYHFFQLGAFSVMAIIVMRLKLFWTPHLCLVSSLLSSHQFFSWMGSKGRHRAIVVCIVAAMSYQGLSNLQQQWRIQGEFSNVNLEHLVDWINGNTDRNAVFAGPMPLMATIKLCTGRPIVNHPHYEDAGLRNRTRMVYTIFSRKDTSYVWSVYREMGVHFIIVEEQWCLRRSKPGCGMTDLWDMEDNTNLERDAVCKRLYDDPAPYFKRRFKNDVYHVYKVVEKPVLKYKPSTDASRAKAESQLHLEGEKE